MTDHPVYCRITVQGVRKWVKIGIVKRDYELRTRWNRTDPPQFQIELTDDELPMLVDAGMDSYDLYRW